MPERNQIMASANPNPVGTVYRNDNEIPSHLHLEGDGAKKLTPERKHCVVRGELTPLRRLKGLSVRRNALHKVLLHISKVATADCTVLFSAKVAQAKKLVCTCHTQTFEPSESAVHSEVNLCVNSRFSNRL